MIKKNLNYLQFQFEDKKIFVVKDHPVVLKCWRKLVQERLISPGFVLFHIDRHSDFYFNEENRVKSQNILNLTETELDGFIQNNLRSDNSEFIVNAMLGGLISDVISIHYDHISSIYGEIIKGNYETTDRSRILHDGRTYHFYIHEVDDIAGLFGQRSLLSSKLKILELLDAHQDTKNLFSKTENMVLDIDLDFFTYNTSKIHTYALNKRDILRQINSDSFNRLLEKAKHVTIALELYYCGSEIDSAEILDAFCNVFTTLDFEKIKRTFLSSAK